MPLRAVLFDFDGVVADAEPVHLAAFQEVLKTDGLELTRADYYQRYLAYNDRDCLTHVYEDRKVPLTSKKLKDLLDRKANAYRAHLERGVPLCPGAENLIRSLSKTYPLSVASGALRHEITTVLDRNGLRTCFSEIVCSEDVTHGKPDPETFLTAMKRLSDKRKSGPAYKTDEILVVEDSPAGLQAAKTVGMVCLAVGTSVPLERLKSADLVVPTLESAVIKTLENLFA